MAKYSDNLYQNGVAMPAVLVGAYDVFGARKDVTTTDKDGYFEFNNLSQGQYTVKLQGGGFTTPADDFLINIVAGAGSSETDPIVFNNTPTLSVTENNTPYSQVVDGSLNQLTTATIVLHNLDVSAGILSNITLAWKPDFQSQYNNNLNFGYNSQLSEVTNNGQTATYTATIPMYDASSSTYDFKASFFNVAGSPAVKGDGSVVEVKHDNVTFNGVPDIQEYVEVIGASGLTFGESGTLSTDNITMQWTNLKELSRSEFESAYPSNIATSNAFGAATILTYDMVQNIDEYGVFMFVSTFGAAPTYERPGLNNGESEPNGSWQFLGNFSTTTVNITLPENNKVGLWIGLRQSSTGSSTLT